MSTQSAFDPSMHLSYDVPVNSIENPKQLKIRLKSSKTDPFRAGVSIFAGKTDNELCPVVATLTFISMRGGGPSPLFNGAPLTWWQKSRTAAGVRYSLMHCNICGVKDLGN